MYSHNDIMIDLKKLLSDDEYLIVVYRVIYNMKNKEIAETFDIPIGTVGWKYSEAIKKARKYFKEVK